MQKLNLCGVFSSSPLWESLLTLAVTVCTDQSKRPPAADNKMFMHKGEEKETPIIMLGATHFKLEITGQMLLIFSTLGVNSEQQHIHSNDADYEKLSLIFSSSESPL